jgi:mRNA interferase MazF
MVNYIPKQKDILFLDFNPTKGHEQSGTRPALVLSSNNFNKNTNMAIVCPITSNTKEFPSHYILEQTKKIKGSVLCEHVRSIDYNTRRVKFVEKVSNEEFDNIMNLFNSLFDEKL